MINWTYKIDTSRNFHNGLVAGLQKTATIEYWIRLFYFWNKAGYFVNNKYELNKNIKIYWLKKAEDK